MLIILVLHFVVALVAPVGFRWLGRNAFYVLALVPAGSFLWLLTQHDGAYSPGAIERNVQWIPQLGLSLDFRLDPLSWVMCLLVLGVGALVLAYCARYFKKRDAGLGAFGAELLAFAGVMFGLVTANNLLLMYIFWELTSVLSYLLIGYSRHRLAARRAALQALVVTTLGGLAMLVGLILLGVSAGSYRLTDVLAKGPQLLGNGGGLMINTAIVLVLMGAVSKSALFPFHFWLPGAMAAPTPVSAYLHAAAMVKAGVYLVARLAPGYSASSYWQWCVLVLGLSTMLLGGWRALRQHDLKLILAYGTVSQLGFLTVMVGLGTQAAALAGLALLLAHGLFKATLFLVVGIIDHQTGTRDIRLLSGVFSSAPVLGVVALVAAASMAGIPPLAGFVAKESALDALLGNAGNSAVGVMALTAVVLGSVLTFAYSARFIWGGFAPKSGISTTNFKPVPLTFLAAPLVLSVGSVVYGCWPGVVDGWLAPYAAQFGPQEESSHVALWHGLTPALGLSGAIIVAGIVLFVSRTAVGTAMDRLPQGPNADSVYRRVVAVLDDVAIAVTGRTQRGSLFFYLAVILSTSIVLAWLAILWGGQPLAKVYVIDPGSPVQLLAGAVTVAGGLAAARANKRFLAVLMVSVSGYGIALIFALQGAPDLALTQMLVETVVLIAFVLAMRTLPARLRERTAGTRRAIRIVIGVAFGITMVVVALTAMAGRTAVPISTAFAQLAYQDGGGANIVNVTLVDIRAWDTFGEISVLAIAATGVASLIFVRGRGDRLQPASTAPTGSVGRTEQSPGHQHRDIATLELSRRFATADSDTWLVGGRTLAPERRSIIFEVATRLVFHSMIIFSVYLLLAGHNSPGGGFAGGLMAGLALAIRYLAGGRFELAEAAPVRAGVMLGGGLGLAALTALFPLLLGGDVFQSAILHFTLPVFGDIKFVTATFFDIGVYLVVVGLVLDILRSLGAEVDSQQEAS